MDPLDEQLRGAMTALDAVAPPLPDQYFAQLPDLIMTRLEDPTTMQPTGQNSTPDSSRNVVPPPASAAPAPAAAAPAARVEDSGLHDLKALAQSTKQRMSRRIPTQNPVDDVALGASSSGLRAVALPEPARMVALPELSAVGLEPAASRTKAPSSAPPVSAASVPASLAAIDAAPAAPALSTTSAPAFSLGGRAAPGPAARKSKTPLVAAGAALAAAAGVVGYLALAKSDQKAAEPAAASAARGAVVTELPAEPVSAEKAAAAPAAAAPAAADLAAATAPSDPAAATGAGGRADESLARGKGEAEGDAKVTKDKDKDGAGDKADKTGHGSDKDGKDKGKDATTPGAGSGAAVLKGDQQEQSLDDLLREAGVDPNAPKKADKPTLEKKSLTAGDIRTAMSARAGAAKSCFGQEGPSGNVPVKLSVAPDGTVKSAKAGGAFAGTPLGECVAKAAAGATFPAWDGAVMSVNYSYSPPDE